LVDVKIEGTHEGPRVLSKNEIKFCFRFSSFCYALIATGTAYLLHMKLVSLLHA